MKARTLAPATLLLFTSVLIGCADGDPTSPTDAGALAPGAAQDAALAQGPDASGVIVDASIPGQICGIPVIISYFQTGADFGNVFGRPAVSNGLLKVTYTNPDNGNAVQYQIGGQAVYEVLDQGVTDQGDTWVEIRETRTGVRGKLGPTGGPARGLSAGKVVVEVRVTFLPGGPPLVELLDTPFLAGPDDPASLFESPEQCAIMEDVLL